MTEALNITYESVPQPEDLATVRAGLSAYNRQYAPDDTYHPLTLFIRNQQGIIVGGLLGGTGWSWLYVEILWLSEEIRAHGYGSRLLAEAERMAVERGCIAAQLDTMSFQAQAFYERHGYTVFGVLDNFPPGHCKYYLQKPLSSGDPTS
jgi:GNAT superfamily N-acetyltransferase